MWRTITPVVAEVGCTFPCKFHKKPVDLLHLTYVYQPVPQFLFLIHWNPTHELIFAGQFSHVCNTCTTFSGRTFRIQLNVSSYLFTRRSQTCQQCVRAASKMNEKVFSTQPAAFLPTKNFFQAPRTIVPQRTQRNTLMTHFCVGACAIFDAMLSHLGQSPAFNQRVAFSILRCLSLEQNEKRTHLWQNRVQWEEPWRHRGMLLVHRMPPPLRPGSLCADTDFTLCSWVGRRNGPPVFGAQRGVCVCSRLLRVVTSHLPRASGTGDTGLERNQEVRVCFFFTRGGLKKKRRSN